MSEEIYEVEVWKRAPHGGMNLDGRKIYRSKKMAQKLQEKKEKGGFSCIINTYKNESMKEIPPSWGETARENGAVKEQKEKLNRETYSVPDGERDINDSVWDELYVETAWDEPLVYNSNEDSIVNVINIPAYCMTLMWIWEEYYADKNESDDE